MSHVRNRVPALRFASAGMALRGRGKFFVSKRFGDPYGPPTIEFGLWGRHSLHQSLPDKNLFHGVIPDGEADPGSFSPCVHLRNGVPALRFAPAGMTVVLVRFLSRSALVTLLVTQPLPQLF